MQPDRTSELSALLKQRLLVLDGAMGTMIQRHGLTEKPITAGRASPTIRMTSRATTTCCC